LLVGHQVARPLKGRGILFVAARGRVVHDLEDALLEVLLLSWLRMELESRNFPLECGGLVAGRAVRLVWELRALLLVILATALHVAEFEGLHGGHLLVGAGGVQSRVPLLV